MHTRFDPFREMDRLTDEVLSAGRTRAIPMDAYQAGGHVVLHLDLPGVDPGSIDLTVERRVLTVRARRTLTHEGGEDTAVQWLTRERSGGLAQRQVVLGDTLDTDQLAATYDDGVLTLTIPVSERAKPRKIEVARPATVTATPAGAAEQQAIDA